jgi:hypothetical protein
MWRPIIIIVVCFLGAGAAFYVLRGRLQSQVVNQPYIVAIKTDLETVRAAQGTYREANGTYARDVGQLPANPDSGLVRGVHTRIVAASDSGYLVEGRSDYWAGRCLLALGSFAGDSLKAGEPRCYAS